MKLSLILILISLISQDLKAQEELWLVTAYCPCKICCGKTDGITASGRKAQEGRTCALNWLSFGTRVEIEGLGERIVEDRGAKSLFGSKKNQIKHLDIFFSSHQDAKNFGRKHLKVKILRKDSK